MPTTPRFSIVVPTHNRGHLLAMALQSVLASDFDDFEIIVSDDQSTDGTASVAASFNDARVSHVRTPRRLSMSDHFEWASTLGSGEYVMFMCDDDAISPELLSRTDTVIREAGTRVVTLKSALYYPPTSRRENRRNTLQTTFYSGRVIECESRPVLKAMLRRFRNALTPRANNSFTERRLVEQIRKAVGRFFLAPAPDSSSSCLVLGTVASYILLDDPLHLFGQAPESIGADQETNRGTASAGFAEAAGALFELSPFRTYCVTNIIGESYLQARRLMPEHIPTLDLVELYVSCSRDLDTLDRNGVDVSADRNELSTWARQAGLRARLALPWDRLRTAITLGPFGRTIGALKHGLSPPAIPVDHRAPSIVLAGENAGFGNIAECAARLPALRSALIDPQAGPPPASSVGRFS